MQRQTILMEHEREQRIEFEDALKETKEQHGLAKERIKELIAEKEHSDKKIQQLNLLQDELDALKDQMSKQTRDMQIQYDTLITNHESTLATKTDELEKFKEAQRQMEDHFDHHLEQVVEEMNELRKNLKQETEIRCKTEKVCYELKERIVSLEKEIQSLEEKFVHELTLVINEKENDQCIDHSYTLTQFKELLIAMMSKSKAQIEDLTNQVTDGQSALGHAKAEFSALAREYEGCQLALRQKEVLIDDLKYLIKTKDSEIDSLRAHVIQIDKDKQALEQLIDDPIISSVSDGDRLSSLKSFIEKARSVFEEKTVDRVEQLERILAQERLKWDQERHMFESQIEHLQSQLQHQTQETRSILLHQQTQDRIESLTSDVDTVSTEPSTSKTPTKPSHAPVKGSTLVNSTNCSSFKERMLAQVNTFGQHKRINPVPLSFLMTKQSSNTKRALTGPGKQRKSSTVVSKPSVTASPTSSAMWNCDFN